MNLSLFTCYTQIKHKERQLRQIVTGERNRTGLFSQLTPNSYKDVNINTLSDKELVINASYTKIFSSPLVPDK